MSELSARLTSAIFVTFSGNCKKALTFYQSCFGGQLHFEYFPVELKGYTETPIVSGSLISDRIVIHGSDLVYDEGRRLGNYIAVFLHCKDMDDRRQLVEKLDSQRKRIFKGIFDKSQLIEITDAFDVRWILGI